MKPFSRIILMKPPRPFSLIASNALYATVKAIASASSLSLGIGSRFRYRNNKGHDNCQTRRLVFVGLRFWIKI
ncbi:expressed protein [Arabidopsis lyrata subsp. lyrata]|uniref:Expressed protein n=1 Tax=Arabidopsis lyrata subsp. lyrata TaxID=81972 RepID=D7LDC5_ARALL|nr:expressed protein [Arabidopsis lyrata subsp. lyrata]